MFPECICNRLCLRYSKRWLPWPRHKIMVVLMATMSLLLVIQYTLYISVLQNKSMGHLVEALYSNLSGTYVIPNRKNQRDKQGHMAYHVEQTSNIKNQEKRFQLWDYFFRSHIHATTPPPLCPDPPPGLEGHVAVTYEHLAWRELEEQHPDVERGGTWRPKNCTARHRVAIIVPYRERSHHLRVFLHHIHPFLQRQLVDYSIYVIEQDPYSPFNRGMLLNIGFTEAMNDANYTCAIFHDVDLLPENDFNLYYCPDQPRHMSAAVDEFAYRLPYESLFGGIEAFSREHFELINGFSNKYFGWGAEDDDLYQRIEWHGLNLTRYPMNIARYSMIRHMKNEPNPSRLLYLGDNRARFHTDGLNSLKYDRKRLERRKLFTWIYARINQTAILKDL